MLRAMYYKMNVNWIVLILLVISTVPVAAGVITVKASGNALNKALVRCKQGDTLELEAGVYRGKFHIPPKVTVVSKELHKAVINGSGHSRAVIMLNGSKIHGISVTGSKIGVYSEGLDNSITGCRIYENRHSGIVAVANAPEISDNIIYRNSGSGITLWDLKTDSVGVSHNTIVYNGNHGISIGGKSVVHVRDNIIAFNHKLKIKVDEESLVYQEFNNYYLNIELNELLPEGNFSFDPYFSDASSDDYSLSDSSRCVNSGSDGSDIGSEIFANFNN